MNAVAWLTGHPTVLLLAALTACLVMIVTLWVTRPPNRPKPPGRHRPVP